MKYVSTQGFNVAAPLHRFLQQEVLPGTTIQEDAF